MFGSRILLLIPHPDDEIVGCFRLAGEARAAGARILGAYLSNGVPERRAMWPWQRRHHAAHVARRWREAREAMDLLSVEPVLRLNHATRTLRHRIPQVLAELAAVIETCRPEVVWTPAYEGGHQDHDVANFLASRFAPRIPVWEFSEYNYAGGRVRSHRFPVRSAQDKIVMLGREESASKLAVLRIYASERGNLRHIAVRQEAIRPLQSYDYGTPPHSGCLFYQRFQWVPVHPRVDRTHPAEVCRAMAAFGALAPPEGTCER